MPPATRGTLDLNADAGESFGPWVMGDDEALFRELTSVNLACGFHAGDPSRMLEAIARAERLGVAVGAHPGYPDLVGFGRRFLAMSAAELHAAVVYQVGALRAMLEARGMRLHHVKAHGALYLQMARDDATATAVARAVSHVAPEAPLVVLGGPGGDKMRAAAAACGVRSVDEAFPDRAYDSAGNLVPRSHPRSLIRDPEAAAERAVAMVTLGRVEALDGSQASIRAETLCVHGDNPEAVQIAAAVRRGLAANGVELRAF